MLGACNSLRLIMHTSGFDIESILRKDSGTKEHGTDSKVEPETDNMQRNTVVSRRPLLLPRVEPIQWSAFVYNMPYGCSHCDESHVCSSTWYGQHGLIPPGESAVV